MKFTEDYRVTTKDSEGRVVNSYVSKGQFSAMNTIGSLSGIVIAIGIAVFFSVAALIFLPLWFIVNNNLSRLNKVDILQSHSDAEFTGILKELGIKKFNAFKIKLKAKIYIFNTLYIVGFILGLIVFAGINDNETWMNLLAGSLLIVAIFTILYILLFFFDAKKLNTLADIFKFEEKKWIKTVAKLLLIVYFSTLPMSVLYGLKYDVIGIASVKIIDLKHSKSNAFAEQKAHEVSTLFKNGFILKYTLFENSKYTKETLLDYLLQLNKEVLNEKKMFGNSAGESSMNSIFEDLIKNNNLCDFSKSNINYINSESSLWRLDKLRKDYRENLESCEFFKGQFYIEEYVNVLYISLGLLLLLLLAYKITIKEKVLTIKTLNKSEVS